MGRMSNSFFHSLFIEYSLYGSHRFRHLRHPVNKIEILILMELLFCQEETDNILSK